jgi:hypothetical protein
VLRRGRPSQLTRLGHRLEGVGELGAGYVDTQLTWLSALVAPISVYLTGSDFRDGKLASEPAREELPALTGTLITLGRRLHRLARTNPRSLQNLLTPIAKKEAELQPRRRGVTLAVFGGIIIISF